MKTIAAFVVVALASACGGSTDTSSSGGTGGAKGGSGGATGGSGNIGGSTGGTGNIGGATGGAGNIGGATGGTGNIGGATGGMGNIGGSTGGTGNVGGSPGTQCNPNTVTCEAPTPFCPPGQVPSVQGACWGPCVPILSCATEPNCDNCTTGFCAAYQAFTLEYRCVEPSLQCQALACSCLAQYFCVDQYSSCTTQPGSSPPITCSCPTC